MLSNIAKAFYYIFSLAPLVILSICPLIYPKLGHLTLIIVLLSILLVVAIYYGFIVFIKKSIAESTICVQSVEVNDESLLGTLLTYIIPLIGFFFQCQNYNLIFISVVGLMFLITMFYLRIVIVSPFIVLLGYHCYKISIKNGVSGCLYITRRNIRSSKEITHAIQVFSYVFWE